MTGHSFHSPSNESLISVTKTLGCSTALNVSCCQQLLSIARVINNHLWYEYKKSEHNLTGADIYTTVILGLFASIIILLMVRSVRSTESLDEQVVTLLSSMQMRIEHDETMRHRKSMREAKRRAQILLANFRTTSIGRVVSMRTRSASSFGSRPREASVCSVPAHHMSLYEKPPMRARSYNGILPSIVVHDDMVPFRTSMSSPPASR